MADIEKINKYLANKKIVDLDMSGADLRGLKLCDDQPGSGKLENINFENANLEGADVSFIRFNGSNFKGANFTKSKFSCCHFDFANLDSANLSNSEFHFCSFTHATLSNCNLTEISLFSTSFIDANLEGVVLENVDLSGLEIIRCNLQRVNLERADLYSAVLSNSDLSFANLRNANLIYTNLSDTILNGADLTGVKICESDSEIAEIIGKENLKIANIRPYSPPIHRSINFVFESNDCSEYITTSPFAENVNTYHSDYLTTIKVETKVHRDSIRYCLSIETLNEHILSLKNKVNISERHLFIHEESETKIELRSLENDECGNTLPVYGLIIYLSEENEVTKCVFRLLDFDADIEYLKLKD